jgi:hypothetical protein
MKHLPHIRVRVVHNTACSISLSANSTRATLQQWKRGDCYEEGAGNDPWRLRHGNIEIEIRGAVRALGTRAGDPQGTPEGQDSSEAAALLLS